MNKNKFIKRCLVATVALLMTAVTPSCDYLNVVPDNVKTLDHAFASRAMAERYLATCYSYLPNHNWPVKSPETYGGGESHAFQGGGGADAWTQKFFGITAGAQNTSNPIFNTWDASNVPDGNKGAFYKGIRDCNIFLERMDEGSTYEYPFDIPDYERLIWVGEVKFIKAYLHYLLMRQYGAITIRDKNMSTSASKEELLEYRNSFKDCVDYVDKLMLEAVGNPSGDGVDFSEDKYVVPFRIEKEASEMGRITKAIIFAARAKFLTMVASPLFNGNVTLISVVDNKGRKVFEGCDVYDVKRWEKAAEACKVAIDLATSERCGHIINRSFQAPVKLTPTLQQEYNLRQILAEPWNKEIIWGVGSNRGVDVPQLFLEANPVNTDKQSKGSCVQRQSVDINFSKIFYSENGVPIEEDNDFLPIDRWLELRTPEADGVENNRVTQQNDKDGKPYRTIELNYHREPRYYANVGFDGSVMWGASGTQNITDMSKPSGNLPIIACKTGQPAGMFSWERINITGMWCKKHVFPLYYLNADGAIQWKHIAYPVIRLADIMLLRAECLNEIDGPGNQEIFDILDDIRDRAGLKGVKDSWNNHSRISGKYTTQEGLREIIQTERRIELSFEGHSLWDLLRWKDKGPAPTVFNTPCKGWNIRAKTTEIFHTEVNTPQGERVFGEKNYLWPFKESTLEVNPNIAQNPGW